MTVQETSAGRKQATKASFDRARNRLNNLETICKKMHDSSDPTTKENATQVVGIIADLRTEISGWQELFNADENGT